MYSLKTTGLKTSLYDTVPWLCFCWGLVLACHIWLAPQLYLELAFLHASVITVFVLYRSYQKRCQGELSIRANQAVFHHSKGRYLVEFESVNGWRLLAKLTPENAHTRTTDHILDYAKPDYLKRKFKQTLFEPTYLSVYHTTLSPKEFAYLRSFAAYQCHMSKTKEK